MHCKSIADPFKNYEVQVVKVTFKHGHRCKINVNGYNNIAYRLKKLKIVILLVILTVFIVSRKHTNAI